jgi:hypothetical protein
MLVVDDRFGSKLDKATEAPTPLYFRFAPKATVGRQHAIPSFNANRDQPFEINARLS